MGYAWLSFKDKEIKGTKNGKPHKGIEFSYLGKTILSSPPKGYLKKVGHLRIILNRTK